MGRTAYAPGGGTRSLAAQALLATLALLAPLLLASALEAQDAPADDAVPEAPGAPVDATANEVAVDGEAATGEVGGGEIGAGEPGAEVGAGEAIAAEAGGPADAARPKVAVVLVGDADDRLRGLAAQVDAALEGALERPFDPGLRAALRGSPGTDDGLDAVRRERRRLGMSEQEDAPILATLGRRAGAVAVVVVRAGEEGPELVLLDVRRAAFFEGALAIDERTEPQRIASFVARRARAASRAPAVGVEGAPPGPTVPAAATAATEEPEDEPDFFEQYWPYGAAALLLAAMITAIALTSTADGGDQPVIRFVPGGR